MTFCATQYWENHEGTEYFVQPKIFGLFIVFPQLLWRGNPEVCFGKDTGAWQYYTYLHKIRHKKL